MQFVDQLKLKYKLMINYLGVVFMVNSGILLLPLLMLFFYPEDGYQAKFFIIPSLMTFAIGLTLWLTSRKKMESIDISVQEAGIIVVFSWIITCILSAFPFVLEGTLNFTQGMFESVSGWTTTGLSVVDVSETSKLFLFWRSIMQLFGGAGIAVIVLASILGPSGRGLYSAEGRSDLLLPNISKSAKLIMTIYLGYIASGTLLYILFGMSPFDAINHAIAALSTGGFSTVPTSIGHYDNVMIEGVTIVLMLAGTINFAAHYILLKGNIKQFLKIGEIKWMFFLLSFSIPLVAFFSIKSIYFNISKVIRVSIFEIVSALTTTGFSTVGYNDWDDFAIFIMIILMLIGGGTGSTAGGIKQYRVYVLYKSFVDNLKSFLKPPKRIRELEIEKPEGTAYLGHSQVNDISNFVFIYMLLYMVGVSIMLAHGYPLKDSMFEFASSIGTVGLSVGITSATTPPLVLWTQTIGMFLGRLEILIIFYAASKLFKDIKALKNSKGRVHA